MPQSLAEQILSHAAGQNANADDVVTCRVDLAMIHDSIAPSVIRIMQQDLGVERVWNRGQVAVTIDHVAPAASIPVSYTHLDVYKRQSQRRLTSGNSRHLGDSRTLLRVLQPRR